MTSFKEKEQRLFAHLLHHTGEGLYREVIALGRSLPPLRREAHIEANRVPGCQSLLYLETRYESELFHFQAHADALISQGLAALLIVLYSGERAEVILHEKPKLLERLGLPSTLSPTRVQGLYSIHLFMKQQVVKVLV